MLYIQIGYNSKTHSSCQLMRIYKHNQKSMVLNSQLKPRKLTIDDLGGMISRLEDRLCARIDSLEQRVFKLETKVDFRFNALQNQLDNIYLNYVTHREQDLLKSRVTKLEKR